MGGNSATQHTIEFDGKWGVDLNENKLLTVPHEAKKQKKIL